PARSTPAARRRDAPPLRDRDARRDATGRQEDRKITKKNPPVFLSSCCIFMQSRRQSRGDTLVGMLAPPPTEGPLTTEELQLATRNRGMPLEALRYDITPAGLHYLLDMIVAPRSLRRTPRRDHAGRLPSYGGTIGLDGTFARHDAPSRPT